MAFAGGVLLSAAGIQWLLDCVAFAVPGSARAWVGGIASLAMLAMAMMMSWGALVESARGTPRQDVRQAVAWAESLLPTQGVIYTSGFTEREIAYYATRPVRRIIPTADPAGLVATREPLCYFRLYGDRANDPILDYFRSSGPPGVVIPGMDDRIAIWCFKDGAPISMSRTRQGHGDASPQPSHAS